MKVLVFFSNPPGHPTIRLDREDKTFLYLGREFSKSATIEKLHASEVADAHKLIAGSDYDVIQFSGHGSDQGVYLDKDDLDSDRGELVSADRLLRLIELAQKPPRLVVLLCCYSHTTIQVLANAAPFVISSEAAVEDAACIEFVRGFYEHLFRNNSIATSFEHAIRVLEAKKLPSSAFRISRRSVILRPNGIFIESTPVLGKDSILINLDACASRLDSFGMPKEELLHLISRKLAIHRWIFDGGRDRAVLPIGRLLFGTFSWHDANDIITCNSIAKLHPETSRKHWQVWATLLTSYNDLASSEYRHAQDPSNLQNRNLLSSSVRLFEHHVHKYLEPSRDAIEDLGFRELLPHIEFAAIECEKACDNMQLERYPQVLSSLELALTHYHEVVDGVQPSEDK